MWSIDYLFNVAINVFFMLLSFGQLASAFQVMNVIYFNKLDVQFESFCWCFCPMC